MMRRVLSKAAPGLALVGALLCSPAARAQQDQCPPGSTWKAREGAGWCEPSVCDSDAQCSAGEVCRPLPLCVEVGKLDPKAPGDAGAALMARQRCGENKSCPQSTVCSDKSRCISKAQADKMGLLTAPAGSASAAPNGGAKKSACGCTVPGSAPGTTGLFALACVGALVVIARRARR